MNVAELFKAMGNSVDRVHLFLADGGPHPSSLGDYAFDEDWKPDGNEWAILDTKNGIPERYHSCKVTSFYLYEGSDGGTVIDIGISEHEDKNAKTEPRCFNCKWYRDYTKWCCFCNITIEGRCNPCAMWECDTYEEKEEEDK